MNSGFDPFASLRGGTQEALGHVLGSEDATPLEFWVGLKPDRFLQLDDLVFVNRKLPDGKSVAVYGVVTQVRTKYEGTRFDTDVFLVRDGTLPAEVSEAAKILATRFEPEIYVPPLPGDDVFRAAGEDREFALYSNDWNEKVPIGLSRSGEPVYANLEFLDGRRGAHVNISGVSGVATKSTYALFLLYSLFGSGVLGAEAINTRSLVFNVKGEDLLFLDKPNSKLTPSQAEKYGALGLSARPFSSVTFWAPPRRGVASGAPDVSSRSSDVTSFFWTIEQFCKDGLMLFLFADSDDERNQYTMVLRSVMAQLQKATPYGKGAVQVPYQGTDITLNTFKQLTDYVEEQLRDKEEQATWAGSAVGLGTINAFIRRLQDSERHLGHLIRADIPDADSHLVDITSSQLTVVDIHNLNDRAQRFVVGAVLRTEFERKERSGSGKPLLFVVLDELNKYAPRDGSSPIKEILLDVAERGRSLGIILIGAQQTASEVERRVIANSALRVVGRLDSAEATREEYRFLPDTVRQRATILKPGTMVVSQPELPVPVVLEFPFPAWATRQTEAALVLREREPENPLKGLL